MTAVTTHGLRRGNPGDCAGTERNNDAVWTSPPPPLLAENTFRATGWEARKMCEHLCRRLPSGRDTETFVPRQKMSQLY